MGYRYVILGAGRQGTACAYDLCAYGDAREIILADTQADFAEKAIDRLRSIIPSNSSTVLSSSSVSAEDQTTMVSIFKNADAVLSAVPYCLNVQVVRAAIAAGASMCDLGGDTPTVLEERKLDGEAQKAGVRILPDCGLAPGINNLLAVQGMEMLDETDSVQMWCGGLPETPIPPLGYRLSFNLEGLLNNYFGKAFVLRDGQTTQISSFTELEEIEFGSPLGKCEAFVTAGATSTCPWSFEGKINRYEYKTVRYPGHYDKIRFLRELGLLDTRPLKVKGKDITPRDVFVTVLGNQMASRETPDLVVLRVICKGKQSGKPATAVLEMMDFYDQTTGFSAMERTTGYTASIIMIMMAKGEIQETGVLALETAVPSRRFIEEINRRGIIIRDSLQTLEPD